MPDQNGMCEPEWEEAKERFTTRTAEKKPAKKVPLLGIRLGTGIDATLEKLDKAYVTMQAIDARAEPKKLKAAAKKYEKLLDQFNKKRMSYKSDLDEAEQEYEDRQAFTKELKILSKTLAAIEAGARANLATARSRLEVASTGKFAQIENSGRRKLAERMRPSLVSAIKNATLFMKKVEAADDPKEAFNTSSQDVSRRITQCLNNIELIRERDGVNLLPTERDLETVARARQRLLDWANDGVKLGEGDDVEDALNTLQRSVDEAKEIRNNLEK